MQLSWIQHTLTPEDTIKKPPATPLWMTVFAYGFWFVLIAIGIWISPVVLIALVLTLLFAAILFMPEEKPQKKRGRGWEVVGFVAVASRLLSSLDGGNRQRGDRE